MATLVENGIITRQSKRHCCRVITLDYKGLFINPSGISELDYATTKSETAERSISIGRESLQVLFVLGAWGYFQFPPLGGSRNEKWRSQWITKRSVSWNLPKLSRLWRTNRPSGPIGSDGLFFSQRTGSHSAGIHVPFTNCFVCRWFCVVHDPKPPLHSHNRLSFGKFQDTEHFLIHCERHFSSRLPPSGGTGCTPRPLVQKKKKLGEILYLLICSFLPCLSWLLRSRLRKSRRDLWITLYMSWYFSQIYEKFNFQVITNWCSFTCKTM